MTHRARYFELELIASTEHTRMVVLSWKRALSMALLSCVLSRTLGFSSKAPGADRQRTVATDRRPPSAEEIRARQSIGEDKARSRHDNFSTNALFVNVDERPEPARCAVAPGSDRLPPTCPPAPS